MYLEVFQMRLQTQMTKNGRRFTVIKTVYDTKGVEHTVTVEKLGNEHDIRAKYNCDPLVWAKEYVAKLNEEEKKTNAPVPISFSPKSLINKNQQNVYNIGYLFLQSLYYSLGLHNICKSIKTRHSFEYDLNNILSRLIYTRILSPCSKSATLNNAEKYLEQPKFDRHQIYNALDVLAEESDFIQEKLYSNSFALGKRHCGVIYYDCTNLFFDIDEQDEDGLRKYGKSKENRPLPIVELGLFIDYDGIPLAMSVHPGNTNEQVTLKPLEEKLLSEYQMSQFVVCTDAGLASKANRKFNDLGNRAYIVTQSIKKLKADLKEWALDTQGWHRAGHPSPKSIDISKVDKDKDFDTVFYKEQWIERGGLEEKIIVTFSFKYKEYQRNIRAGQVDRAIKAIDSGKAKRGTKNQNDYRRFIAKKNITADGEIAEKSALSLNTERIAEEEQYDGFYAVASNLDSDPLEIIKVNKMRWQIEECFRVVKLEFKARPIYVRLENRIKAHLLTCYIALVLYKYLDKVTEHRYSCEQLFETLKEMNMLELVGKGYVPAYKRTEITDMLHEIFSFRTDYEIIKKDNMKKILKHTKTKIQNAKF